jgi:hypothetical protein
MAQKSEFTGVQAEQHVFRSAFTAHVHRSRVMSINISLGGFFARKMLPEIERVDRYAMCVSVIQPVCKRATHVQMIATIPSGAVGPVIDRIVSSTGSTSSRMSF